MKISNRELVQDLKSRTEEVIAEAKKFQSLENEQLNWKASPEKWSILECYEHLNRYADFYTNEIANKINTGKKATNGIFKSGWLGEYFAKSMLPKEKLNTMKTFSNMNPVGSQLKKNVLDKFIGHQEKMLLLLDQAEAINLSKTKTGITISNWIKLRLGDTFRVVIYHNQRHTVQAQKVLKMMHEQVSV